MHEMGIAMEVAKLAEEEARRNGASRVECLCLRVGKWSGAEPETLRFALESISGEFEILAGSRVEIETVEPTFSCTACGARYVAESYFDPCPTCGSDAGELVGGDELLLASIEVEDA